MSRTSNRLARFSGLAVAGAGLSHFTSPQLWEPIVKPVFPRAPVSTSTPTAVSKRCWD
jgi:uncharacterized membrane protein